MRDILRNQWYNESLTYIPDLKKFRPILRIQSFIDLRNKEKKLPEQVENKRKAVVRDWWRLIMWYIRLR